MGLGWLVNLKRKKKVEQVGTARTMLSPDLNILQTLKEIIRKELINMIAYQVFIAYKSRELKKSKSVTTLQRK